MNSTPSTTIASLSKEDWCGRDLDRDFGRVCFDAFVVDGVATASVMVLLLVLLERNVGLDRDIENDRFGWDVDIEVEGRLIKSLSSEEL